MSDQLATRYRRLFKYEKQSHAKVLAALQAVPEERRAAPEFQRAVDLFAHVVAAREMWLARLGQGTKPSTLEPQGVPLAELGARLTHMEHEWTRYLTSMNDAEVHRGFDYQSLDAGGFHNTVDEVLTQLYGHALYHRGQISLCLKALGEKPPTTDFIYFARVAAT